MEVEHFIANYREAFGEKAELPLVFWYSDQPVAPSRKIEGCLFKGLLQVRKGEALSFDAESIGCGGGRFYTGFSDMPARIPEFVSLQERYKRTPEMVLRFIRDLGWEPAEKHYLNFMRLDRVGSFDRIEGLLFYATPDMLSGLAAWTFFDNDSEQAVTALFGSGCSAVVTQAVAENRRQGRRTFLGMFDPSARPYIEADRLSFVIPLSRFREMYDTMRSSCLFDTHDWAKVRKRINR